VDRIPRRKRIAVPPTMAYISGMANTLVTDACRLIEAADDRVPTAPELARALDVSIDALRRAFRQVLGVTPRQYGDSLRRERLRRELRDGEGVTRASGTARPVGCTKAPTTTSA
jgi:methylphosphotriester-DNA--protein-cysteine methyltransferase